MSYLSEMYAGAAPVVLDLETTARHKGDYFAATPYDDANHVVLGGFLMETGDSLEEFIGEHSKENTISRDNALTSLLRRLLAIFPRKDPTKKILLIGVNIGFDLSYIMHRLPSTWGSRLAKYVVIWDCAAAEYFLSGQLDKYPSMNKMALKYGLPQKPDTLKSYMDAGVDVEDIPVDELTSYLRHDLVTTRGIYDAQMNKLRLSGVNLDTYYLKMEDILMTTTMECNGMHFDKDMANDLADTTMTSLDVAEAVATTIALNLTGAPEFNIHSNAQLSTLFYGGEFKREGTEECVDESGNVILYKSGAKKGLVKTKKIEIVTPFAGVLGASHTYPDKTVDEERLCAIMHDIGVSAEIVNFIGALLRARMLRKDLTTYYIGYAKFAALDDKLHTSLNQTATGTGRLSSSRPNLQNCAHDSGE